MKAVMISIQPKWCNLIASGEKTIELRKTRPKIDTPFKCYIYCTIGNGVKGDYLIPSGIQCGKVIGEFVCEAIEDYSHWEFDYYSLLRHINLFTKAGYKFIDGYLKGQKKGYGWHISDLVIYDKPREIGEFFCKCNKKYCTGCEDFCDEGETIFRMCGGLKAVTRPPRSWQYVEEKK